MTPSPPPWQITLARLDGALPFIDPMLSPAWALAALRRLWHVHVRDYPFDNVGIAHEGGVDAAELMRSWFATERSAFLSWIARRAPPPLARAARLAMAAKGVRETFTAAYAPADWALDRLDALLPSRDPASTLLEWVGQLREAETVWMEGASEELLVDGHRLTRRAPRGAAWAASLAAALRPQLFGLGAAPFALAGLAPRSLFRVEPEQPLPALLDAALGAAARDVADDLRRVHASLALARERLIGLYASSRAAETWALVVGLGPLSRAEIARALEVTPRSASKAAEALAKAGLATMRPGDSALVPLART